jgi:hypothetical protein
MNNTLTLLYIIVIDFQFLYLYFLACNNIVSVCSELLLTQKKSNWPNMRCFSLWFMRQLQQIKPRAMTHRLL